MFLHSCKVISCQEMWILIKNEGPSDIRLLDIHRETPE